MTSLAHGLAPKMRPISRKRASVVAALDIGTAKIVCMIGRLTPQAPQDALLRRSHAIDVLGVGHTRSAGIKAGTVVEIEAAESAVRHAVDLAERGAGVRVESVVLAVTAGRIASELYAATVPLRGAVADHADIERVLAAGSHHSVREGRVVLHSLPVAYALDDTRGIHDPRGMVGRALGIDMHLATADAAPARNLMLAAENCHLAVEALACAAYASGLSALADDEADLGAAVVDMGAGTTTIAVFSGGRFVHADGFALGGQHITMDLARGLSTTLAEAERIKTLYGSAMGGPSDDRDMVTVPQLDEAESAPHIVPRSILTSIIKPRAEEILEMVRDRLQASPFAGDPRGRIVLAGGASQLTGLAELASRILGRSVRLGRPLGVSGLAEQSKGPAFAAAAGLLVYPQTAHLERFEARRAGQLMTGTDGYFSRVGRWLRESF